MKRPVVFSCLTAPGFAFLFWMCAPDGLSPRELEALEGCAITQGLRMEKPPPPDQRQKLASLWRSCGTGPPRARIAITYPQDRSVFPPDFTQPTFLWVDRVAETDFWLIAITFPDSSRVVTLTRSPDPVALKIDSNCITGNNRLSLPKQDSSRNWTPGASLWGIMKEHSLERWASVSIWGFSTRDGSRAVSMGRVRFSTSRDSVGAPVFYRDVPLMPSRNESGTIMPLAKAAQPLITWRLRNVSEPGSRTVIKKIHSCANCHSFSRDGNLLGMDIDGAQNDKGTYTVVQLAPRTIIRPGHLFTWNDFYLDKDRPSKTIGFLSRVSPGGRYVVTTINEKLFIVNYLQTDFIQVFYPTRGQLAYYDGKSGAIRALPGAADTQYVHCNPVWSPDEKWIIFSRARAKNPFVKGAKLPKRPNAPGETQIQYDLYRIPFHNGMGGKAEPVSGASGNGMSNTFPKVSPDNRFIVFVQCRNGQLLRPDSKLWIVPADGGEARQMNCNTRRMNSWHSFSPSGRWMVFSSKAHTDYTQMFLTHIDTNGYDTPPILIPNSTADNRAVNLPEFVNRDYDLLEKIEIPAVDHFKYVDSAHVLVKQDSIPQALRQLRNAYQAAPHDQRFQAEMLLEMSWLQDTDEERLAYTKQAIAKDQKYPLAYFNLGVIFQMRGEDKKAAAAFNHDLKLYSKDFWALGKLADIYMLTNDRDVYDLNKALRLAEQANTLSYFREPGILMILARAYSEMERFDDAVATAEKAREAARDRERYAEVEKIGKELMYYRNRKAYRSFLR